VGSDLHEDKYNLAPYLYSVTWTWQEVFLTIRKIMEFISEVELSDNWISA